MNKEFKNRVDQRQISVGIIGLGYVGLPLVLEFADKGFKTLGFDVDREKIDMLLSGKTYIRHIPESSIEKLIGTGLFDATDDPQSLAKVDAVIVCVPTPLSPQREPDISYVTETAELISHNMGEGQLIVLESTTYPGTTDEVVLPILEKNGLKCGEDFFLAYSPEREDPANATYSARNIPKVVGGHTAECRERACYVYGQIVVETVPVSSTATAEAVKLTENIFRSVNIALVNELKVVYSRMGIDIWEVIDGAKTKPFGFMPFYPGPGLGGHCIPIDPFYLTWKAREYECSTRFIELAGEINVSMPEYVIQKLMNALNDHGKSLKGSAVLVVGLAYKNDVDDIRESPSLKLLEMLLDKGAKIAYHDSFVPRMKKTRDYKILGNLASVDLTPESIGKYDAVLISTAHSTIDYNELVKHAKLIVDTRNATKGVKNGRNKIVKA